MTAFRRAAHARLVTDPRRGRLLLQLAYVALREAERIGEPKEDAPTRWHLLSEEERAEHRWLLALGDALDADAGRFGITGGTDAAFRDVYARAEQIGAPGDARAAVARRVVLALRAGAPLSARGVIVRRRGEVEDTCGAIRPGFAVIRDDVGAIVLGVDTRAADAFVGAQGAGEAGALEALAQWEADPGPPSTVRSGWTAGEALL